MSYYTKYTVEVTADEYEEFEIAKLYNDKFNLVENLTENNYRANPWYGSALDVLFDDVTNIDYTYFKDTTEKISMVYPEVYFTIYGVGEEWDDRWVLYCKNGVSELCEMRYIVESPENLDIVSRIVTSF